jgi:hypothetical protein
MLPARSPFRNRPLIGRDAAYTVRACREGSLNAGTGGEHPP